MEISKGVLCEPCSIWTNFQDETDDIQFEMSWTHSWTFSKVKPDPKSNTPISQLVSDNVQISIILLFQNILTNLKEKKIILCT